jgi:hypothetical protein
MAHGSIRSQEGEPNLSFCQIGPASGRKPARRWPSFLLDGAVMRAHAPKVEPRSGGIYLVNVTGARFARGSFREVVPVHRLAYSFRAGTAARCAAGV